MTNSSTPGSEKHPDKNIDAKLASLLSYYPEELERVLDSVKIKKVSLKKKTTKTIIDFASAYCCLSTNSIGYVEFISN